MVVESASIQGLVAATYTPMHSDGSINLDPIPEMVDHLVANQIAGLYVLGSTGEGPSLTHEERCRVAEAFVLATAGRIPVIVQVGCESLTQARGLAEHAQKVGADGISAVSPVYFKPDSVDSLVASMDEIAKGARNLPFYYYHIPTVTGVSGSALDFLKIASERISNLRGIKFTSSSVFEYQACVEFAPERFEILWGFDEMLMSGLAAGGLGAVGSTYNYAAPVYQKLLAAWHDGDIEEARRQQSRSQELVRTFVRYGARSAQKAIMSLIGFDCGPSRLPVASLSKLQTEALRKDLETIGYFDWIQ